MRHIIFDPLFVDGIGYVDNTPCPMDVDAKDPHDRAFKGAGVVPVENFLQVLEQKDQLQKEVDKLTRLREEDRTVYNGLSAVAKELRQELDDLKKRKIQSENDLRRNVQLARARAYKKADRLQEEVDELNQRIAQSKADRKKNKVDRKVRGWW